MKSQNYILEIPEPCNEDWEKMGPSGQGRHCGQCKKVVIDFSAMNDEEIIRYLREQKGEVCGRVRVKESQLDKTYHFAKKHSLTFNTILFRYSLAGLLTIASLKSYGQTGKNTPATFVQKDNSGKVNQAGESISHPTSSRKKPIQFRVQDRFTGKSLMQAYIRLGLTGPVIKPVSGSNFSFEIPDSLEGKNFTLYIFCPGYETGARLINDLKKETEALPLINLFKFESMKMGKMVFIPEDSASCKSKK